MANKRNDRKAIRREEAAERQATWDALTEQEKLAKVGERMGMHPDSVLATKEGKKIRAAK